MREHNSDDVFPIHLHNVFEQRMLCEITRQPKYNPYESSTHLLCSAYVKRGRRLLRARRRVTRARDDTATRETRLIINLTTSARPTNDRHCKSTRKINTESLDIFRILIW